MADRFKNKIEIILKENESPWDQFINVSEGSGSNPYGKSVKFNGISLKKMGEHDDSRGRYDSYLAFKDGSQVGNFSIDFTSRAPNICVHTSIKPEFQRQGIGTIIYSFVEQIAQQMNTELVPSPNLSKSAEAHWKKRSPDKLSNNDHTVWDL